MTYKNLTRDERKAIVLKAAIRCANKTSLTELNHTTIAAETINSIETSERNCKSVYALYEIRQDIGKMILSGDDSEIAEHVKLDCHRLGLVK